MFENNILLPQNDNLNIRQFSRLFNNMSASYKIFWFRGIIDAIYEGRQSISFKEIIHAMIADAWYMVTEYRLNLGTVDKLGVLVQQIYSVSGLKSSAARKEIIDMLDKIDDPEIIKGMRNLTLNVPYRLQAPFFKDMNYNLSLSRLAEQINTVPDIIYHFEGATGLEARIVFHPEWMRYIRTNYVIINGWIRFNLIDYLQRRNPNVPGISNKLEPPQARNLAKVKKYWEAVIDSGSVYDIYGNVLLNRTDISIDHFVPWSYVAHDELWNLSPTTKSINSQKSNHLPDWEMYFNKLCSIEYQAYERVQKSEKIRGLFIKCQKEHVNDSDIQYRLYREDLDKETFSANLRGIIEPVYHAAVNMGFESWCYHE